MFGPERIGLVTQWQSAQAIDGGDPGSVRYGGTATGHRAAAANDGFAPPSTAWYVTGVLTLGWLIAYLDRQIIVILTEPLRHALALNDTQVSLVQGFAFSLFFVLAGLPIGRLIDRANRRNILFAGILMWSVMTIACGLATSFWGLFAARIGVGVGEACLAPASFSLIADVVRPSRRGAAMGLMVAGTSLGNACSILIGGFLLQRLGVDGGIVLPLLGRVATWQLIFFAVGTPGLVLSLVLLTIREPERRERSAPGHADGGFFRHLKSRKASFATVYCAFAMNMITGYSVSVWAPVLLMRVHHMQPGRVGLLIGVVLLVVGTAGAIGGGWIADRISRWLPSAGHLGVPLICHPLLAIILIAWAFQPSATFTIIVFTISGPLLGNMINAATYPTLNRIVPNEMRGQTIAVYLLIANLLGLGLAPTAVGAVTDFVLRDPQMIRQSVIMVSLPAITIGFLCAVLARRPYRTMCAEVQQAADAAASR
jgi:MFS family permease